VPRTPSFSEADVSDKPAYVRAKRPLSASEILNLDSVYANMARSLLAADEWLSTLESALADAGQLENTYVVVASDNGWMSGQHRIRGAKGLPYEESLRMPLYAAGPGVAPGSTIAAGISLLDYPRPSASTPWVSVPGSFRAHCSSAGGANVLQVAPLGGAPTLKPSPDAAWGLHLTDVNIALGNLLDVVKAQAAAYAKRG